MRLMLAILLPGLPTSLVFAHTLGPEVGLAARLSHQLAGAHHWPFLLIALFIVIGVAREWSRRRLASRVRRQ